MYNLADLSLQDMTACSTRLRRLGIGATSMDDVANRLVRYLHEHLIDDKAREPACALVRLFRTQAYSDLSIDSQTCVQKVLKGEPASSEMKCLTLAATAGERLEWNHIAHSQLYKAIPLVTAEFLTQFPMFSQLFIQLGVDLDTTLRVGSNLLLDANEHTFNVFHVPHARGSPFVPVQQDFVIPFGIQSVVGFGGLLPTGNLFTVVLFSKVFISSQTADLFKTFALSAKLALLPFDGHAESRHYESQVTALEQLLTVHEEVVITYAAQRKRAEKERKRSEEAINALVRGTASVTGEEFFPVFVRQLAAALDVSYAFVTEIVPGSRTKLRVLAGWEKTTWGKTFEYESDHTPCGIVLRDGMAYYARDVQHAFPDDQHLVDLAISSYLAVAMVNSSGENIGHVCVMDAHPLKHEQYATSIMNVFAARAGAELERLHTTAALRQSEARQALILNSLPIAFYTSNQSGDGGSTWVSENLKRLTGFASCRFLDDPGFWAARLHPEDRERVLSEVKRGRDVGTVSVEYRWQIADGSYRWYLDNGVYTRDVHGTLQELIGAWIDITHRKLTEEALRESETRFKAFMDHNPAVIFMKDEEGRHVYVNREFERSLQVNADEWLGRTDHELWPPHIAKHFGKNDEEVFASNDVIDTTEATVNKSGLHQSWRIIKFPIKDVVGKCYLGGIAVDVTERKRAEEAVKQAEERYRGIFENAVEGIFQTTPEGRYLTVNPALARLYGYDSPEEMVSTVTDIGKHLYVDPSRRQEFFRLVEGQGSIAGFESQIIRKDRQVIWISENARVVWDASGRIMRFEGTVEDVTARKHAEQALRESEERLRLSLSVTQVGIWDWNIVTGCLVWSDTVALMFGLPITTSPPTYEGYIQLIHPDDREIVISAIARSVAGEAAYGLEHRLVRLDGTVRWMACRGEVFRSPDGTAVRMLGTVQDITERKRSEAELQSALTSLRTLSGRLEVIREEERGRIARELHDEFGVGLTCLKMDLSRLTALIGNTVELEKGRQIEDKIRSMEEFIDATIGGVQRIVSELRPAILDDLGLVAAIEWQAQDFQRRTGIACTLHVNEDHLEIDSERATVVFRICQEALTNVARHANATAVGIRLEGQEGTMILEVTDNGRGIAEEKIVDPRALGLLGMRERAELLGGCVTIAGRPEAGTIVTLHVLCSRPSSVVEAS